MFCCTSCIHWAVSPCRDLLDDISQRTLEIVLWHLTDMHLCHAFDHAIDHREWARNIATQCEQVG